ncbi:fluoride efflux transporter CrcB [Rhodococcus phenolicus]|uniref:fluoride efflux transporter CrcB n=1 Tax=Rhodococcus phenolicus TaxID=263849 RepID=UPI000832972C|nr:fluoride efflux transporter CrcB [Rhodococcus phenolicus]
MTVLLVALGGGAGAVVRYLAGRYIRSYRSVPVATLAVNVFGCALLGALSGATLSPESFALLGSGFCGGLTTYSTFAVEAVGLTRIRRPLSGIGYVVVSVVAGLAAAWAGYTLTS